MVAGLLVGVGCLVVVLCDCLLIVLGSVVLACIFAGFSLCCLLFDCLAWWWVWALCCCLILMLVGLGVVRLVVGVDFGW